VACYLQIVLPTKKKKFFSDAKYCVWEEPFLYKLCRDGIYKRCLPEDEVCSVLYHCHTSTYGGHFELNKITAKVLQAGFYWPTLFKDVKKFIITSNGCQRAGNIFKRHEMPQTGILEVELFNV